MASFNKVILAGNLTRDPEFRVTPNGQQICKLGIAINRRFTTQSGEQRDETTYVDVDAWGKQAEVIGRYFSKGKPILIEGRLKLDQWQTPQGESRSRLGVTLETFSFVDGGGQGSGSSHQQHGGGQPQGQTAPPPAQGQPAPFSQQAAPPPQATSTQPSPDADPQATPSQAAPAPADEEDEDVPF
jgi:single-strand DNA-binding protein